jgi:hypothetical protein
MLRIIAAALVVALSLHVWGEVSSRLLPWPDSPNRRLAAARPEVPSGGRNLHDAVAILEAEFPTDSSFSPPRTSSDSLLASNSEDWPLHAFRRVPYGLPTARAAMAQFALHIVLGLVTVLLVAALLGEQHLSLRRIGILALIALFLVLLTDVTHGLWMEWPVRYIAVLSADHGGATVLASATASGILWLWPKARQSLAAKPAGQREA